MSQHRLGDRLRAADRPGGPIENGQGPVSGEVDLAALVPGELSPDDAVTAAEQVPPPAVPELGGNDHSAEGGFAPMVAVGDIAPNFSLADVDGRPITLSDVSARGRNALLVFLRHLG